MSTVAHLPHSTESSPSAEVDGRSDQIISVIKVMISDLPPPEQEQRMVSVIKGLIRGVSDSERERLLAHITEMLRPIPASRGGEVYRTIVRLLPKQKSWTVEHLKQRIEAHGVEASAKAVYNALGHLTRKGRIRRVGYGRYLVDGVEVIASDDFGGPSCRHEDAYRTDEK
jgi:hypothetical protein